MRSCSIAPATIENSASCNIGGDALDRSCLVPEGLSARSKWLHRVYGIAVQQYSASIKMTIISWERWTASIIGRLAVYL